MSQKVSVIIPVYNGEHFIYRAIDSVLKQTFPVEEIIIINDGSSDGTEKILEQFRGKIIYKTIPNGGVANARNIGIAMSKGDWIAFLDADDVWYPNKLERQMFFINKYPSVGFSCANYKVYIPILAKVVNHFSTLKDNPGFKLDYPVSDALRLLVIDNFIGTTSNVLVHRKILRSAGSFNTQYRQAEDYDLWLRCAMHTDFIFMSEVLLCKDSHESNLTNNQLETCQFHYRVLKDLLVKHHDLLAQSKLLGAVGLALADKNYQMSNILYEQGELKSAFVKCWQGFQSSWTFKNFKAFLWVIMKKTVRTVTGGFISKKTLKKIRHQTA